MIELAGWGNYPVIATDIVAPRGPTDVPHIVGSRSGLIARGQGRAYGDAAVGQQLTLSLLGLNRMIAFDSATGRLTVEAGITVADILNSFVPRGFFLKVVPGTKFVTIGGVIAADVHGKNHHRDGGFGDSLESLRLVLPTGETITCSRFDNPDLFAATVGGMGLTGVIVEATLRLLPIETGWLRQQIMVANNLDEAISSLDSTASYTYSVAWIDCLAKGSVLGRSLIYAADHATAGDRNLLGPQLEAFPEGRSSRLSAPVFMPGWILNRASIGAFNDLYFRRGAARAGDPSLVHWDSYFFPLDAISDWNRIYGRRGFVQHQCVVPSENARGVLAEILGRVAQRGSVSFLAVLKQLGQGHALMSFPMRGYTLAMDFPVTGTLFPFLDEIDALVVTAGGRLYLAKDARQSRATFEAGYPGLTHFRDIRRNLGADGRLISHLSTRLGI